MPPRLGRARRLLRAGALAAGLGVAVGALALGVRGRVPAVVGIDDAVVLAATDVTRAAPVLHRALVVWQEALLPGWVNLGVVLVCAWASRHRATRDRAPWTAVTVLVGWGVEALLKVVVRRDRPVVDDAVAHASGFSFPSGHAANTTTAAIALTVLVWPLLGRRARVAVPTGAGVVVVLTALDRVLLGVHHPSDVVAGVLVGGAVAGASYVGFRRWDPAGAEEGPAATGATTGSATEPTPGVTPAAAPGAAAR
jgi:membrane-associated phospholipid phosphatase